MVSSGIQRIFYFTWTIIKLNMLFILFTFLGGVIFGIGPAFQAIIDLLSEYGIDYQNITYAHYYESWKYHFKRSNLHFCIVLSMIFLVLYSLFLSVQMKGFIWFMIDIVLIFLLLLIVVLYMYLVQYENKYEISTVNLFKLAFISIFFNFFTFLKIIFGIVGIIFMTWNFKGLLLFASFALIAVWSEFSTKENRSTIARKLEEYEKTC